MYRIIEDSFWDDPQIAALSKDEKVVTVCLFSNVHTKPCGIYRIGIDRLAAMTKVSAAAVPKVLRRLEEDDLVYYDGTEVCIPGYIRRQRYKGPLIAKRIVSELAQVKNRGFVEKVVERYLDFLKLGGYKPEAPGERIIVLEMADGKTFTNSAGFEALEKEKPKGKRAEIAELAEEIKSKLKLTANVKKTVLEDLVKSEPGGIAGVRAALARAVRYYETAKAEKWKSFVIARRFSKFVEFYDDAFGSDDAAAAYLEKIRAANARELRKLRSSAATQVGAPRQETETRNPIEVFLGKIPEALQPLAVDFEALLHGKASVMTIEEKLLALFKDDPELVHKERFFLQNLGKPLRTPENARRYRINYIKGKYGVPDLEEAK